MKLTADGSVRLPTPMLEIPLDMKLAIWADAQIYTYADVSKRYNVSARTVMAIVNDPRIATIVDPEMVKKRKEQIEALFIYRSVEAQGHVTSAKLDESSALQLTTISAINFDKSRLAGNLSTENVSIRDGVAELSSSLRAIREKREALEAQLSGR